MIRTWLRLALALAALSLTPISARASDCIPGVSPTQCYPTMVLVDPVTGAALTSPVRGVAAYAGNTITAGGTAQSFLAANPSRRGFTIQNQSTGDLYIKIGGTATLNNLSLKIAPGQLYESSTQHVSTAAISIIGATTGQAFYATEF